MATKKVNTRVMNKCDLDENWRLATNFTPKKGELIIYQNCAEPASSTNYVTGNTKFKIGDGTTKVGDLPFQADDANSYEVITLTSNSGTLEQEVYDKIISSPFNKIKYQNKIYIFQRENEYNYYYASNNLTNCSQIELNKTSRRFSESSMTMIASPFVMHNYIGAKDTPSNAATVNGNTYLKLYENKVKRSQFNIKGTGATTVTSDKNGNVTIHSSSPFLSLGLGQTTYPITGDFTEEQADKLISAPFSTITFSPGGSPDSVPMLPQTSEQSHYSYIWKGSDANYTYTINATLNRTSDGHGGLVWMSKSYTITREANGGGDVQQTNGFYPYKVVVYNNPVVGTTYSYNDSNTDYYPSDCSYRQGQMIIDKNGVIYKVTATTMCECVYIPEGATAISTEDINAICSQVILNSEDVDL